MIPRVSMELGHVLGLFSSSGDFWDSLPGTFTARRSLWVVGNQFILARIFPMGIRDSQESFNPGKVVGLAWWLDSMAWWYFPRILGFQVGIPVGMSWWEIQRQEWSVFPRILDFLGNQSFLRYSQKSPGGLHLYPKSCGVWGRNSIHCLRMENLGNFPFSMELDPVPGQLLIPELMRIPWNGNPLEWESPVAAGHGTCCPPRPGQNSKGSGKPGRAPEL